MTNQTLEANFLKDKKTVLDLVVWFPAEAVCIIKTH